MPTMIAPSPAPRRPAAGRLAALLLSILAAALLAAAPVVASDTPDPASVTIAGSFQSELGCPGDWQPDCVLTHLAFDAGDGVWQGTFTLPAGSWEYKAALDDSWDENYGANATPNGANIALALPSETAVKLYYDHETHWVTDDRTSVIAVAPGSFQSELGCPGDWDPGCLRSWLEDPDGDGIYSFSTDALPAGDYEVKVAIGESWDENYGAGGVQNGPNIPFTVTTDCAETVFTYDPATHLLTVTAGTGPVQPASVTIAGSFQSELGCPGDWQPDCALTHLAFDAGDGVWQGTFTLPAGSWEYKAALDDSWDENYGADATPNGANIALTLPSETGVKLYYDHGTHWVTDDRTSIIAVAPGSFQSELGCPGDWDPGCLRSWLEDPDGDGFYSFTTRAIPPGTYEVKVAIGESWDENYGAGGVQNGPNIPFTVPAACTEVFFGYDPVTHLLTVSAQGAPKGNLALAQAHWVTADTVAWNLGTPAPGTTIALHYDPDAAMILTPEGVEGGSSIPLTFDPAGLAPAVLARFPHLAGYEAFKVSAADLPLVPEILRDQTAVSAVAADGTLLDATSLQIPGVLDDLYPYDGPLGVSFDGGVPALRVWAPTARGVTLERFADSDPATLPTAVPMDFDPATGVWSVTGEPGWNRDFYLYEVEVYTRATGQVELNLVTDPYSVSLSADSLRSQIVDLDDPTLEPPGWEWLAKPPLAAPEDIVLYELHVRDFSIADTSVPEAHRGTFLAFTDSGSAGMSHLRELAAAGLTHIHLLPAFDFATVPERRADQLEPAGDLGSYPPDSDQQQAAITAVADQDGFNWGYDPFHYTVPEGSYATDPDGPQRILEFRRMVQALNQAGLRVVMDVVYNHTTAAGESPKSVLDRIVPGYYHRLSLDGALETSTCCANTASEHAMMGKLLRDSVVTWAREYKVDGFRFDLMGHHMKADMLAVRDALAALTPAADGVDGSKIYLYGEGWNFGEVADNARGVNATQLNMAGTGIGTFSDRLRDAVRGGNPFGGYQEQGFANGLYTDPNGLFPGTPADELAKLLHLSDQIRVGLAGNLASYTLEDMNGNVVSGSEIDYNGQPAGYTADPQEEITYVSAHDNETLFDANQLKVPFGEPMAERVRIEDLGLSLVGLGQGIPFFHAGSEILRSKSLDRDSYDSGDWFNHLDWTLATNNWGIGLPVASKNQASWPVMAPLLADPALKPQPEDLAATLAHFEEVLRIRKSSPLFRLRTAADIESRVRFWNTGPFQVPGLIAMTVADPGGEIDRRFELAAVLFNADDDPRSLAVPSLVGVPLTLHPVLAASADPVVRTASFDAASGNFSVPGRTTAVFLASRPPAEQLALVVGDVQALVADGTLNGGQGNALIAKLEAAIASLASGNETAAVEQVKAFLHQVDALVRAGILTPAEGEALAAAARAVLETIAAS